MKSYSWFKSLLLLLLVLITAEAATEIQSGPVSCQPSLVGQKNAELIVLVQTVEPVPKGAFLKVTVPDGTSVTNGVISCGLGGWDQDSTGLTCEGASDKFLYFELRETLPAFQQNRFRFQGAFNAPLTSEQGNSFKLQFLSANKIVILAETTKPVLLSQLKPNQMQSVTIATAAGASRVVGELSTVAISVTSQHPIPAGGGLEIVLPKWNYAQQDAEKDSYITRVPGEPICSIGTGMQQVSCLLIESPAGDVLIVKDMFPKAQRLAADTFVFKVNNILNPLSMSAVGLTVTSYSGILSESSNGVFFTGLIDTGTGKLKAELPSPISPESSFVSAKDPTVSASTELIIQFRVGIPIMKDLGCTVLITLPDDFQVVAGQLSNFKAWGMFDPTTETIITQINEQQRTIKIEDQCSDYTHENTQSTIRMAKLVLPPMVKTTGQIKIQILDKQGQLIASVENGVTFRPQAGNVDLISLVPHTDLIEVQEVTNVELVFTPQHPISAKGRLVIKMPNDLPATCNIAGTSGGIIYPLSCSINGEYIQLDNPFEGSRYLGQDQRLSITFRDLKLPNSQRPILGITLGSYDMLNGQYYVVDWFSNSHYQFFTPKSVSFLSSTIDTKPPQTTYTEKQLRFTSVAASQIPAGSVMKVQIPAQIGVISEVSVMSSCNAVLNLAEGMKCVIATDRDPITNEEIGTHTITIQDAFPKSLEKDDTLIFTIKRGLMTPISTESTESFQIIIYDAQGYEVNFVRSSLTLTMQQGLTIEEFEVKPDNYTVGAQSMHRVTWTTPVPFRDKDNFIAQIFVPQQIETPRASEIKCRGTAPLSTQLSCYLNGNRVTVELHTARPVVVGDSISIEVGPLTNPGSTKQTDFYKLSVRSASYYEVAEVSNYPGSGVTMHFPSQITNYTFEAFDMRQKALTTISIDWYSTQTYPENTKIVIEYDQSQISPLASEAADGKIPCIFRQSRLIDCELKHNIINVEGIIKSEEYGGSHMYLTITNMYNNVEEPLTTTSWILTTYLSDGVSKIDQINKGLTLTFKCEYPCLTCLEDAPSQCTSCNTVENDSIILYDKKCYERCPDGTFFEYFQCKPCDSKCLTCEYLSGTSCTQCDEKSAHPFLNGKDCSATCNYGEYGNIKTKTCETCAYPCENCIESPGKCTQCKQDALEKYFFDYKCLVECPTDHYVDIDARNNVCLPCSDNCLTCELTRNTCTSCRKGMILNNVDGTCVQQCPTSISIYEPANATHAVDTCEPCHSSCKTCEFDSNHCTSCRSPLSLKRREANCVLECDVFLQSAVSVNNVCTGCSSSCLKCQNSPDYCTECVPGTYFYRNSCVRECPLVGDYQFEPNEDGNCWIPGLICPFGYKVNEMGTGCDLTNQECEEGYELNAGKTACVPVSNFYVPFPILITLFLLYGIPVLSKLKYRQSLLIPNMIAVTAFIETITIVILVAQANDYGIVPTFYLGLVSLVFLFASNAFFTLMYVNQIKSDTAFKHWQPKNTKVALGIQFLGLFNFRIFRLLYSKLFNRMCFNAPFNEPNLFYKPFNLTSLFAIITVTLPLIVSCVIGLIYVRWGYQLYITCIELLFISVVLITLQLTEYCLWKFEKKQYVKVTKRQVDQKVRSDFPDSDEDEGSGLAKRQISKPKAIRSVRHLEHYCAQLEQKDKWCEAVTKEIADEIEQLHDHDIMRRQLRRCQSFKLLRPPLEVAFQEIWDSQSDSELQNFISEPSSPRSKEMLFNRKFVGRMHHLTDVYKMRDQFDNCYSEAVSKLPCPLVRPQNAKQQTNILEMLGIDDVRANAGEDLSSESEYEDVVDKNGKVNRRKLLSRKRKMEIPNFDFEDIQGEFDADESGRYVLIQKQGRLQDRKGRLVNRRGYLVDPVGNVINCLGHIIFFADELSPTDDELPEPYCYEKIKQLRSARHEVQFRVELHSKVMEDKAKARQQQLFLEQELRELQQREEEIKAKSLQDQPSQQSEQLSSFRQDDEALLAKLTEPKQPKPKSEFRTAQVVRQVKSQPASKRAPLPKAPSRDELIAASVANANAVNADVVPEYQAMRAPSETSLHRVEQLQEIISPMKDLQFSNKILSAAVVAPMPSQKLKVIKPAYQLGSDIQQVYDQNDRRLQEQRQKVVVDQDFINRMNNFTKELNLRQLDKSYTSERRAVGLIAHQMEQRSGLALKNLSNVYGRVQQKLNQNVTKSAAAGPYAGINKKISNVGTDDKLHKLEEIYMKPKGATKEKTLQQAIDALDVTKQFQMRQNTSQIHSQVSARDQRPTSRM